MNDTLGNAFGLDGLPLLSDARTRSISAENHLGVGWKGRPCIRGFFDGQTVALADIEGQGIIRRIWITCEEAGPRPLAQMTRKGHPR